MKLVIFGASGKTGTEIVKLALAQGHKVTAFVRDPNRLSINDKKLSIDTGDVFNTDSVNKAIAGQDAVICVLGSGNELKKTSVRSTGTKNIIHAMETNKVKRLVVLSAMGIGASWNSLSLVNKIFSSTILKSSMADHSAQENVVMQSGLNWTIVRPSGLTDTPKTGTYLVGKNISAVTSRIARADVADLILKSIEEDKFVGEAVTITN